MVAPDPGDFQAEWRDSGGGRRKASRNLWVYDKQTGQKRYSITTEAGAKIQPYFDVPPPTDPNVYLFTVIGEVIDAGFVRVWLTAATHRELTRIVGDISDKGLSSFVLRQLEGVTPRITAHDGAGQVAEAVILSVEAYTRLKEIFQGVNDDHSFQLLIESVEAQA
jgi:hypothetical protein